MLPPFVLYGTDRMSDEDYPDVAKAFERRLLTLHSTEGLEPAGHTGFGLHVRA